MSLAPIEATNIVGTGINYNLTEIFAVELNLDFSPDLGDTDWKPLTKQLIEENHVSPDISKLTFFGSASFLFSPPWFVLSSFVLNSLCLFSPPSFVHSAGWAAGRAG